MLFQIDKKILYIGNALAIHSKTPTTADTLPSRLRSLGATVYVFSNKRNRLLRLIDMIYSVIAHLQTVDLVLIDAYSTQNFIYLRVISFMCRVLKIPYYPILHGGNLPERLERNGRICHNIFKGAVVNIAPSRYLGKHFERKGFKVTYIPNTIEIKAFPFHKKESIHPHFIWVRAFAESYNPLLAIQVFERVFDQFPKAKLTMVGPKKDHTFEQCRSYVQAQNLPVIFTGKLSRAAWSDLAKNHDIFLNTSAIDNTPVSIIEAMALGLSVVTSDAGGIPFLIDKNHAFILPSNSVDAFVDAIIGILKSPDLSLKKITAAREHVLNFDWKVVSKLWIELLGN